MINSMTKEERQNPELLAKFLSRRRRIARGSGHEERDIGKLVKDFTRMRTMMQQMGQGGMAGMPGMSGLGGMFGMGGKAPQAGFRGYRGNAQKKKKKGKKKKGFGTL